MSKIQVDVGDGETVEIDRMWCEELIDIRRMLQTHDFSGLQARVERLQHHGEVMETAILKYRRQLKELQGEG